MAYSLLSGGKRIRPLLVYATANSIELDFSVADNIAAAIEMIHAYSLIHDDLPAMDDDHLRRGKPTNHIKFDEATAILAGDALQALAFETLTRTPTVPHKALKMIQSLATASGVLGMAGGQSMDLISENQTLSLAQLESIHAAKTGALLSACVSLVLHCDESISQHDEQQFNLFAANFGIAFQIVDDILDVTQDSVTLGKPANSDTKNNKATYPSLLGLEAAKSKADQHINMAFKALNALAFDTTQLKALAAYVLKRDH